MRPRRNITTGRICPICGSTKAKLLGWGPDSSRRFVCIDPKPGSGKFIRVSGRRPRTEVCGTNYYAKLDPLKSIEVTDESKRENITIEEKGNYAIAEIKTADSSTTLEDLLEKCQIDLSIWKVDHFIANRWPITMKRGPVGDEEIVQVIQYQIKAWLIRIEPIKHEWPQVQPIKMRRPLIPRFPKKEHGEFPTVLIIPDSQNGYWRDMRTGYLTPMHDREAWDIVVQVAHSMKPDKIILLGDMLDLAEWTDKFIKSPEFYFCTQTALKELFWWLGQLAETGAEMTYIEGNHECFDGSTEILTEEGWKSYKEINLNTMLATYNDKRDAIEYQKPKDIQKYDYSGLMYHIKSTRFDLLISPEHRIYFKINHGHPWQKKSIKDIFLGNNRIYMKSAVISNNVEYPINDDEIRITAWLITDGSIFRAYKGSNHISCMFYQRKSKVRMITDILERLKWEYSYLERNRNITNIIGKELKSCEIQCEIRLVGKSRIKMLRILNKGWELFNDDYDYLGKNLPKWVYDLSDRQFRIFLESFIDGNGSRHPSSPETAWMAYGKKEIMDQLQIACFNHGYRASLSKYREKQFRLNITRGLESCLYGMGSKVTREFYSGVIWDATTPNDTLVVRRNGRICITGNSRLQKEVIKNTVATYDLHPANMPEAPPSMSIEALLDLAGLGIKYEKPYPHAHIWLNDNLRVSHGEVVRKGTTDTVKEILKEARCSEITGHSHRLELGGKTVFPRKGPRVYLAYGAGTLARIDPGIVPSAGSRQNWQQGFLTGWYQTSGKQLFEIYPHAIYGGRLMYFGKMLEARSRLDYLAAEATGVREFIRR